MRLPTFLEHLGKILKRYYDQKINTPEALEIFTEDPSSKGTKRAPKSFIPMLDRNQGQLTQVNEDILVD